MKYTVGGVRLATKKGVAMPGDTLDSADLQDGVNVKALIAAGHLTEVPASKPAPKPKAER